MAAAVIGPGKMKRIGINDLHVSLATPMLTLCVRRHAKWALRCLEIWFRALVVRRRRGGGWLFRGRPDAAPPASGACFRGSVGEAAYVCRRGAIPNDDRRRLFADGIAIFPETEVRRTSRFARFLGDVNATGISSTVENVRSDNGTEFVRAEFVELLDHRGIRREYIPVGSPKDNGVVERHIPMMLELGMTFCLKAPRLFGDARLPPTGPLWTEACKYGCDVLNMAVRVREKPDMYSPYRKFYGRAPFARLLPLLKAGFHHVKRTLKSEPKEEACFSLNGGNNHSHDCYKIVLSSDRTSYSRDVTWEHPEEAVCRVNACDGGGEPFNTAAAAAAAAGTVPG